MSEEDSFGSIIKKARERMGWTQQVVADKFDTPVNRVTVNRWEKNIQHPSDDHRIKELISILGLNENEADALNRAVGQSPPDIFHVPPLLSRFFTGRDGYLQDLRKLLQESDIVAISGLGGIGKSQIALKYASDSQPDVYRTVLWVNAADTATLRTEFASLAQTLGLPEKDEQELERRIQAVKNWLQTHTKWLLIMDNADELPIVRPFLLPKPPGHIVLTTRWQFRL